MSNTPRATQRAALVCAVLLASGCTAGTSPEETPSPSPSPESLTYSGTVQSLEPGAYSIPPGQWTPARLTFEIPSEGWDVRYLGLTKHLDEPGEVGLATWIVTHVYTDTCAPEGELRPIGPTVDNLVAALEALGGADVSPAVETTVGGFPAKRVGISMSPDLDLAQCRVPALQVWADAQETDYYARIPGAIDSVYVIDVNRETLALVAGHMIDSAASDVAERDAIIASMQIEP